LPCSLINSTNHDVLLNGQSVKDYINDNFSQEYCYDWNDFVNFLTK
jgi:hypothetical protein